MTLRLDLLRHGETELGGGLRGSLDDALTARGWEQMHTAVEQGGPWDCLVSSPLQRCARFAEQLGARLGVPVQLDKDLQELHFGAWEGRSAAALMDTDAEALGQFWADPYAFTPPEGEPMLAFSSRVLAAVEHLHSAYAGQRVLLVSHGGVMRLLLAQARRSASGAIAQCRSRPWRAVFAGCVGRACAQRGGLTMLPFWIALQFLSSLPVRLPGMPEPEQLGRSLLLYPVVGLLFGVLLWLLNALLLGTPLLLHAALLLSAWVLLSGGLHLDGLADSADAWLGGFGDRERTLLIMKDPRSGPIAVITLVLVLLLKFTALLALIEQGQTLALVIVPVLGRAALLCLFLTTPYVRAGGLGQALADHLPRRSGWQVLAACASGSLLLLGWAGLWTLVVAALVFIGLQRMMLRRLQGCTGDTAGALLELLEMAVLVALALS